MLSISYQKYYDLIPEETAKFIKYFLGYVDDVRGIDIAHPDIYISGTADILLFTSYLTYSCLNEENKNLLHMFNFNFPEDKVEYHSISDSRKSELFTTYYEYLTPFNTEEEYILLTPEDIIRNIYDKCSYKDKLQTHEIIKNYNVEEFYKILKDRSDNWKNSIKDNLHRKFNKKLDSELIQFFDLVGSIYAYLYENKNKMKKIPAGKEDLIDLSLFVAIFKYAKSNNVKGEYRTLIDYCDKLGINIKKIEEITKLNFDIDNRHREKSILYLNNYYSKIVNKYEHPSEVIYFYDLLNNVYNDSMAVKMLLTECGLNKESFSNLGKELDEARENAEFEASEKITNGLLPKAIECMEKIAIMYTYLEKEYHEGRIDKGIVDDEEDLIALSVLIVSYEYKSDLAFFLGLKGITLDTISELIKNDFKNNQETTYTNKTLYKFRKYITSGKNNNKAKGEIYYKDILDNLCESSVESSDVVKRIYRVTCFEDIGDIKKTMNKYFTESNDKRKKEKEEKLLKGLSPEVYNFVVTLSSYYDCLFRANKDMDQDLRLLLTVLFSATRCDKNIDSYFNEIGMKKSSIINKLNLDSFSYSEKDFDIDTIDTFFKQYIFDRDVKDITISTILDNALTNIDSFEFDKVLYEFDKTKDDVLNIKNKIDTYVKSEGERKRNKKIESLFVQCGVIRTVIDDTLRIHKYIEDNNKEESIIKTEDDIKEFSLTLSLLLNDNKNKYSKFFEHNGITIEELLKVIGLTPDSIDKIKKSNYDRGTILKYTNYLQDNVMDLDLLLNRLLNDSINPSKLLENIIHKNGSRYEYLKEELSTGKFRPLTPDQGIALLAKEIAPIITGESIVDVAAYGDELNKHSTVINDALHELLFNNTIEHSVEDINKLCEEVSIEEIEEPKSFFSLFIHKKKEVKEPVNKLDVISTMKSSLSDNVQILNDELKGYEYIKKYIEEYLIKLNEYLAKLEEFKVHVDAKCEELSNSNSGDMREYTELLNYMSMRDIIDNKINTFNTSITLMSQELVKIHRAIVTHFITINALNTSNNAILPLIASELALNVGAKSESNALSVSRHLVDLLQSIVNQNVVETKDNLDKLLTVSELDPYALDSVSKSVTSYLEMLDSSNKLLSSQEETVKPKTLEKKV